jgi:hypothetical protein
MPQISISRLKRLLIPIAKIDCDHCIYRSQCLIKCKSPEECVNSFIDNIVLKEYACNECGSNGFRIEEGVVNIVDKQRVFTCQKCWDKNARSITNLFNSLNIGYGADRYRLLCEHSHNKTPVQIGTAPS